MNLEVLKNLYRVFRIFRALIDDFLRMGVENVENGFIVASAAP